MFGGLDDIDWAGMRHAYGEADDVPEWIRGLVADDPATREECLDAMYGSAHHQGDVYECTLAAVPFLIEALTAPGLPGRAGVAKLLASIGGAGWTGEGLPDDESALGPASDADDPDTWEAMQRRMFVTRRRIRAVGPAIAALAADPDLELRRAIPELLSLCAAEEAAVVLMGRIGEETDPEARLALVAAVGRIGERASGAVADDIAAWLAMLVGAADPPSVGAAAVMQLAKVRPALLPGEIAATVVRLVRAAYAEVTPVAEPAGFVTDTLVGSIRVMTEQEHEHRRAPHVAGLIRDLGEAFDDRIADRCAFIEELLTQPEPDILTDAVIGAANLVDRWRGDYRRIAERLGRLASRPEPRIVDGATERLSHWGSLAAPASDALAAEFARLDALPEVDGRPAWLRRRRDGRAQVVGVAKTLAHLGDERVFPALLRVLALPLDLDPLAHDLVSYAPRHADELVPAVRPLLAGLAGEKGHSTARNGLLMTLGACGPAAAPAIPEILAQPRDSLIPTVLGRIGPPADEAVAALRELLDGTDTQTARAAAIALWRIERDATMVRRLVAAIEGPARSAALAGLGDMGAEAAAAAPYVATFLDTEDVSWWTPLRAAIALWRVRGEAGPVLPVLRAAWLGNPGARLRIEVARWIGDIGPAAAEFAPLFEAELTEVRRAGVSPNMWSSVQVVEDEDLQANCRAAMAAISAGR